MKLYKTTIVIWSEYDGESVELVDLARQATDGDAYCTKQHSELVENPESDPDAPDLEFFSIGVREDEDEGAEA